MLTSAHTNYGQSFLQALTGTIAFIIATHVVAAYVNKKTWEGPAEVRGNTVLFMNKF